MRRIEGLCKLASFVRLYGVRRTLAKVAGRWRVPIPLVWRRPGPRADIALVGCGQFGFATIGHFIARRFGARFRWCHDPDRTRRESFARSYRVPHIAADGQGWNEDPLVRHVFIASNHASHADYAGQALRAGKSVYVEKPVAVSFAQLAGLEAARAQSGQPIFAGYNRPFAGAIRRLRRELGTPRGAMTLCCSVSGHQIAADHWYRDPREGTRICGNAGHWIDLFMHMCHWRGAPPEHYRLTLAPSCRDMPDDNFVATVTTEHGDLFCLLLSSRSEPFEGINETIHVQQDGLIAKIDDFRRMELWRGARRRRVRFWPKDVGHRDAIFQPFGPGPGRDWEEIVRSSALTLSFMEMAQGGEHQRDVHLPSVLGRIRAGPALQPPATPD